MTNARCWTAIAGKRCAGRWRAQRRGQVPVIPYTVGSAGAWRFLYQLFVHGTNPAAIVQLAAPDSSLVQGAILAHVPLVCELDRDCFADLRTGDDLTVDGTAGVVTVGRSSAADRGQRDA